MSNESSQESQDGMNIKDIDFMFQHADYFSYLKLPSVSLKHCQVCGSSDWGAASTQAIDQNTGKESQFYLPDGMDFQDLIEFQQLIRSGFSEENNDPELLRQASKAFSKLTYSYICLKCSQKISFSGLLFATRIAQIKNKNKLGS